MRLRFFVPMVVAALAVGALAAACGGGGGGGLTLEEYFQKIEAAETELQTQQDAIDQEYDEKASAGFASDDEELQATQEYLDANLPLFQRFVGVLADLDAPEEAEAIHSEAVEAGQALLALLEELIGNVRDAETLAEAESLFDNPDVEAADARFDAACVAVEGLATANGIAADFDCED